MWERAFEAVSGFLSNRRNHLGLLILLAVLLPLLFLSLKDVIFYASGFGDNKIFYGSHDRFADLVKAALSYRHVTSALLAEQVAKWPQIYRDYLTVQPAFHGLPITHYSMPPFGALFQASMAEIIVLFDPALTIWFCIILYVVGAVVAAGMLRRFFSVSGMDYLAVLGALLLSYPVLFMVFRGNFPAGFTALALAVYVLTVVKGQYRWIGLLCLAMAINFRPNTACLGLLELVVTSSYGDKLFKIIGTACITLLIAGLSYVIVQQLDPDYSVDTFRKAYEIYDIAYVRGDYGLEWNFSLYGTTRILRGMLGLFPVYDPDWYFVVSLFAVLSVITSLVLALTGSLNVVTGTFLATALSSLFTPVFAFYHMTEFAVPLLAVLAAKGAQTDIKSGHGLIFVTCLLCLCPLDAKNSLYPIFIFGAMVAVMVQAYRQSDGQTGRVWPEPKTR